MLRPAAVAIFTLWQLATSAAIFYGYIFIVGLIVWGVVKWFRGELKIVNVFCIYGACCGWRAGAV